MIEHMSYSEADMALGKKTHKLAAFIQEFILDNHYGPNFEEMSEGCGLRSKSNIKRYLEKLKRAGLVDYVDGIPRAIWLTADTIRTARIPICGSISAGAPIPPIDIEGAHTEFFPLALDGLPKCIDPRTLFALRVDGDSMIDASIHHGDLIIVTQQFDKREGDTLVFWLKDEQATSLKRYFQDGDFVLMQPANPKYETRRKHRNQVEAFGKVVLVIRQLGAAA
ncbi:MAG: repressor LexA [Chloroflexota bacterium]|nr:MAG: repressor LexA [Chloroflexota bacterium]